MQLIRLPAYEVAEVMVDPDRGFGQPIFARGGARLDDALALFRAGESLDVVAEEYGVPPAELEYAVRIAHPRRRLTSLDGRTLRSTSGCASLAVPAQAL